MSKEATEIINTLCKKLGVAASVLVPEMAKYNIARLTFLTAAQAVLSVVMAVAVARMTKWAINNDEIDSDEKPAALLLISLIPGLALGILVCCAISSATGLIGWIVSPIASAVKEITSMIK